MLTFGIPLICLGMLIEAWNLSAAVAWFTKKRPPSPVLLIPLLLNVGGILFLSPISGPFGTVLLILAAVALHVLLSVVLPYTQGAFRMRNDDRVKWLESKGRVLR